jgi:hypothetical protein
VLRLIRFKGDTLWFKATRESDHTFSIAPNPQEWDVTAKQPKQKRPPADRRATAVASGPDVPPRERVGHCPAVRTSGMQVPQARAPFFSNSRAMIMR